MNTIQKNKRYNLLLLAVSTLLSISVTVFTSLACADSKSNNSSSNSHYSDSNERGASNEAKKVTVCHVPKGNPDGRHTIHISYNAWTNAHHKNHTGDTLGSCTKTPVPGTTTTTTTDKTYTITGCTGTARETLVTVVQSYFEPVVVDETALDDDEDMVTSISQCLDGGDSSDSNDANKDNRGHGQGSGYEQISDSHAHHFMGSCKNKDSGNPEHAYRSKIKLNDSNYKTREHNKNSNYSTSLIVTDSSMDDNGVKTAYDRCVNDSHGHMRPNIVTFNLGDSGHKYRIVKSCDSGDSALRAALQSHKETVKTSKDTTYQVVVTGTSLQDCDISKAVNTCLIQTTAKVDPPLPGGSASCETPCPPGSSCIGNGPGGGGGGGNLPNTMPQTGKDGRYNWREITDSPKN